MGGILAYELCCKLQKNGCKMPKSVFILGSEPPEYFSSTQYHKLDDKEFKKKLISIEGIPTELILTFHLINGISDTIDRTKLKLWRNYCYRCTMDFVPGNHFFINSNIYETTRAINKNL
ncbi:MAG: hypothetical protein IJP18_04625 [Oscillospiraceae bacterium]|nr:hypothetical protein [Oscillospiraceae bacterium]